MIRSLKDLPTAVREAIRGGTGRALVQDMLGKDEMSGVAAMSYLTLEPGSVIGEHPHRGTEELYLVLAGHGTGLLDGERVSVGPGSFWVVRDGHTHGLENGADAPLEMLALLTKA